MVCTSLPSVAVYREGRRENKNPAGLGRGATLHNRISPSVGTDLLRVVKGRVNHRVPSFFKTAAGIARVAPVNFIAALFHLVCRLPHGFNDYAGPGQRI